VKLAQRYNIPFLATGGRHSYTTTIQALQNGLEIDLGNLNTLKVNAAARTLTVGPGVRVGSIFEPLYAAGLEIRKRPRPPNCIGFLEDF
jgi:FAD/FMN-containing dehydrogenase